MSAPFLQIEKGNYISRIWFFSKDGADFDVLMVLGRRLPEGDWKLDYRFRYYRDDEAFDSKDEKSIWSATFPEKLSESEAVRKTAPVVRKLKAMTRMECEVLTIESDEPAVVIHHLRRCSFAHLEHGVEPAN